MQHPTTPTTAILSMEEQHSSMTRLCRDRTFIMAVPGLIVTIEKVNMMMNLLLPKNTTDDENCYLVNMFGDVMMMGLFSSVLERTSIR